MRALTIEQAIHETGFGRFQKKLLIICGLGWAADAMEVLLISFALPAIGQEWGLSNAQKGFLGTAIFLGMLIGAWVWGRWSDTSGRKKSFILTVLVDSVFGFSSAFSPSFVWLLVLRAATGFGVGGTLPVDYSIFAEYLPAEKRGRYLVILESFWAIGAILAAGLAWLIVPHLGWRWLLAISALPGLLLFIIRRYVPESPRYLASHGKQVEAAEVIRVVAKDNKVEMGEFVIAGGEWTKKSSVGDLFTPSYRRTTSYLWVLWFVISLGYYGVFTWLPNFFRSSGMQMIPVYQNSFILAVAQIPGYFTAAWLVEVIGRKKTLALFLLGSGLFTFAFASAKDAMGLVSMGIGMSFFTLGAWGVIYAYTPEAYPTSIRSTGMGAASGMTRVAGIIAPTLGGLLMGGGLILPLVLFAVCYVIGSGTALLLPRETSHQPLVD